MLNADLSANFDPYNPALSFGLQLANGTEMAVSEQERQWQKWAFENVRANRYYVELPAPVPSAATNGTVYFAPQQQQAGVAPMDLGGGATTTATATEKEREVIIVEDG